MNEEYSLERLADRAEIRDRLLQFSRGIDRREWSLVADAFHEDAVDNHGIFRGSAKDFVAFAKKRHETVLFSMHHLPQSLIEFVGPDTAIVESYILGWQGLAPDNQDMRKVAAGGGSPAGQPLELLMGSRYVDHFERKDGRWAIQERHVVYESALQVTPEVAGPSMQGVMELGRRDSEDMVFRLKSKLDRQAANAAT